MVDLFCQALESSSIQCHQTFMGENYKHKMTHFLKTALLAISAGFFGLTCSIHVRAQTNVDSSDVMPLELRSFFKIPMGPRGMEVTQDVQKASGQRVRITGYMVKYENPLPGSFLLSPRPVQMSEHADGDANDLPAAVCWVYLDPSQSNLSIPHLPGPITVEGQFKFKREEAADGSVAWFHLQLSKDAVSLVHVDEPLKIMTPFTAQQTRASHQHLH
ncbi:MAG: hypothetical protein RLZZ433_15 [Pseudomonadota bacterium]|jgi:hypothetical protein